MCARECGRRSGILREDIREGNSTEKRRPLPVNWTRYDDVAARILDHEITPFRRYRLASPRSELVEWYNRTLLCTRISFFPLDYLSSRQSNYPGETLRDEFSPGRKPRRNKTRRIMKESAPEAALPFRFPFVLGAFVSRVSTRERALYVRHKLSILLEREINLTPIHCAITFNCLQLNRRSN